MKPFVLITILLPLFSCAPTRSQKPLHPCTGQYAVTKTFGSLPNHQGFTVSLNYDTGTLTGIEQGDTLGRVVLKPQELSNICRELSLVDYSVFRDSTTAGNDGGWMIVKVSNHQGIKVDSRMWASHYTSEHTRLRKILVNRWINRIQDKKLQELYKSMEYVE